MLIFQWAASQSASQQPQPLPMDVMSASDWREGASWPAEERQEEKAHSEADPSEEDRRHRDDDGGGRPRPALADEVEPKLVKGEKRYGRCSRPDVWLWPAAHGPESAKGSEQADDDDDAVADSDDDGEERTPDGAGERFGKRLRSPAPVCSSTPFRVRRTAEERTAPAGPAVLGRLDDGRGRVRPEALLALWAEEGVRRPGRVLRTLDFSADEPLSLSDLTRALDEVLLAGDDHGLPLRQAALLSYKDELHHLRAVAEEAGGERDKAKSDLERAERRHLRLVREADERHAADEAQHADAVGEMGRDFRQRLAAERQRAERDGEAAVRQLEDERRELRRRLEAREERRREELRSAQQEKRDLEEELAEARRRRSRAQSEAARLGADLRRLLQGGGPDAAAAAATATFRPEEETTRLLDDYERRCRELRDQNDELSAEMELLRCRRRGRGSSEGNGSGSAPPLSVEAEFALDELKAERERVAEARLGRHRRRTERTCPRGFRVRTSDGKVSPAAFVALPAVGALAHVASPSLARARLEQEEEQQRAAEEEEEEEDEEEEQQEAQRFLAPFAADSSELRATLEACRRALRQKIAKDVESGAALKELQAENGQLRQRLQLSERRRGEEEEKGRALQRLLRQLLPAALRP
ncbi:uncharacterized protein LOC144084940 isoform X2 [Stigmatopora argus]